MGWQIKAQYDQALQSRIDATREHVEIAHGMIAWAHARETSGQVTREQAQAMAREAIAQLRYSGQEYFWINDMKQQAMNLSQEVACFHLPADAASAAAR